MENFNKTMSDDDLFYLMLYSDMETMTNICLMRKINHCHDPYFWKLKFNLDKLPILTSDSPKTFNEWRAEYRRVDQAQNKALEMIDELQQNAIIFHYNDEQMNFKKILSMKLRSALQNYTPNYQKFNRLGISYNFKRNVYDVNIRGYQVADIDINADELYPILMIIFYHYPAIPYTLIPYKYRRF